MPLLLDTVTLSELRRGAKAHPAVVQWQAPLADTVFYVSAITFNEICYGIRKVERSDPAFAGLLRAWYFRLLERADVFREIPVDRVIAEVAADFRYDHRMANEDAFIAATAHIHGLTLATRNTGDFIRAGIALVNPWQSATA